MTNIGDVKKGRFESVEIYRRADANLSARMRLNAPKSVGSLPSVEAIMRIEGTP